MQLRLELEDQSVYHDPTPQQIAAALDSLSPLGNSFAILHRSDNFYMQTGLQSAGEYVIEYQEGGLDKHYQAEADSLEAVTLAFLAYAAQIDTWRMQFEWRKINP